MIVFPMKLVDCKIKGNSGSTSSSGKQSIKTDPRNGVSGSMKDRSETIKSQCKVHLREEVVFKCEQCIKENEDIACISMHVIMC